MEEEWWICKLLELMNSHYLILDFWFLDWNAKLIDNQDRLAREMSIHYGISDFWLWNENTGLIGN